MLNRILTRPHRTENKQVQHNTATWDSNDYSLEVLLEEIHVKEYITRISLPLTHPILNFLLPYSCNALRLYNPLPHQLLQDGRSNRPF
jgi:hypothetical protein